MNLEELPIQWEENKSSIIKVVGVGGGGGNAVSYMYQQGIHNVNFVICNTDAQALDASPVPVKIRMGDLGAGGDPELGRIAAMDSLDKIREVLDTGTKMVFLTAGMGGGTGTGATPVIARVAKELGILTVAIVTMPFNFEGPLRIEQAKQGINELKDHVDSLLIIKNEKLREMYGDQSVTDAFSKADNVLTMAAKGIAELITLPGIINVDFKDVNSTMAKGGITVMGSAVESGENRARKAVEAALNSPLLNNSDIAGARRILLNIRSGTGNNEIKMDEVTEITNFIIRSSKKPSMIWGVGKDEALGDAVSVTIVATDFSNNSFLDPEMDYLNPVISTDPPVPPVPPVPPETPKPYDPHAPFNESTRGVYVYQKGVHQVVNNGPVKVVLGLDDFPVDVVKPEKTKQMQPVIHETFFVRELQVAKQNKIKFDYAGTDTDVAIETVERIRAIPLVVDENVNIDELENIPALVRKQIKLENQLSGTEKEVSKYTLDTKDNTPRIRENNPYIHDVVD